MLEAAARRVAGVDVATVFSPSLALMVRARSASARAPVHPPTPHRSIPLQFDPFDGHALMQRRAKAVRERLRAIAVPRIPPPGAEPARVPARAHWDYLLMEMVRLGSIGTLGGAAGASGVWATRWAQSLTHESARGRNGWRRTFGMRGSTKAVWHGRRRVRRRCTTRGSRSLRCARRGCVRGGCGGWGPAGAGTARRLTAIADGAAGARARSWSDRAQDEGVLGQDGPHRGVQAQGCAP